MKSVIIIGILIVLLFGCVGQTDTATNNTTNSIVNNAINNTVNNSVNETVINQTIKNETGVNMENKSEIIVIETNMGNIEIELNREKAPKTVENFLKYVSSGFFNGTIFHRVIPNFMIQGGGFTPDGNQKKTLNPIVLESKNGLNNNKGTIAMARTNDPNSATSQFFINTKNNFFLDYTVSSPGYAVFGKVINGYDVVERIEKVNTTTKGYNEDWPVNDIIITNVYLKK